MFFPFFSLSSSLYFNFTQVHIEIKDKNDSPPRFADEQISFEISEDLRPGHTIGIVNATDPDTIGTLSYTLESDDAKTFELDKSSGVLKLIDTLDREKQDMYKLAVRASDGVQATDTTVLIQVNIQTNACHNTKCIYIYLYLV